MPILLPFRPSVPHYTFRSAILGAQYKFTVRWNTQVQLWHFDIIESATGNRVVVGVPVVLGALYGRSSSHVLFQSGCLLARDTTRTGVEARFEDCGDRVQVLYFTRDDMANELAGGLSPGP
jgi:hypothetical protein